jgi:site-specific DNA-methyltransferase (adenine-specific)
MIDKIQVSDALEFLKKISDNSIDCCLTDIPYGYHHMDNKWSTDNLNNKKTNSHIVLPMGMKFDKNQGLELQKFMGPISSEVFRVLKPGGFFICFSAPRMYHRLCVAIEDTGFEIRDSIGWLYSKSQVKAFRQDHVINNDKILTDIEKKALKESLKNHRTPQLKPAFENICIAMKPIEGRFIDNEMKWGLGLMDCSVLVGDDKFPSNVVSTDKIEKEIDKFFYIKKPGKLEKGEDNIHPTVKPLELCQHIIKLFTKEDDIVLDPFVGSGTTAVAAIATKRHFCCCDINKKYVDIANKRIK